MKKIVGILAVFLVLLIGASVLWLDSMVKMAVNTVLPKVTKTESSVDGTSVNLLGGEIILSGIKIANPRGFSSSDVFRLAKVYVKIQPTSLLKDVVVVDKILVDGAEFLYEMNAYGSNVAALLDNINSFSKQAEQGNKVVNPAADSDTDKHLFVKEFSFTNAKVSVAANLTKQAVAADLVIPEITLKNIGTEDKGATIAEVMSKGLSVLVSGAVQVIASDGAKSMLNNAGGILNKIKGLLH